jgi:hypothetical protein
MLSNSHNCATNITMSERRAPSQESIFNRFRNISSWVKAQKDEEFIQEALAQAQSTTTEDKAFDLLDGNYLDLLGRITAQRLNILEQQQKPTKGAKLKQNQAEFADFNLKRSFSIPIPMSILIFLFNYITTPEQIIKSYHIMDFSHRPQIFGSKQFKLLENEYYFAPEYWNQNAFTILLEDLYQSIFSPQSTTILHPLTLTELYFRKNEDGTYNPKIALTFPSALLLPHQDIAGFYNYTEQDKTKKEVCRFFKVILSLPEWLQGYETPTIRHISFHPVDTQRYVASLKKYSEDVTISNISQQYPEFSMQVKKLESFRAAIKYYFRDFTKVELLEDHGQVSWREG